ncbi:filamentous hemagglutinin N-terminal domain-containing protein [Sinirhodobacter populi]|uniref:Filamentous hemagglutinin N-terminal domain-containing protein n=1 Tax=Paenirhodobacter populi TaxID=2306993 RepID=A0A443K0L2_9RHOB|nr:filamentous hemagglutinin N-terminal domain-containing protein [Sinirhodobacter populi]
MVWRKACGFALLPGILSGSIALAQVAADGSTDTTVTISPDGKVTVGLAPVSRNGISHNRYDQFNAGKAGVDLDNRGAAARTILNEVTGTGSTTLAGEVSVLGQKAHVIIANPNGIIIDGGRFVNTGRIALTTGVPSITERQIAPGVYQGNVTATVSGGAIQIAGGGLAGQMDAVALIAETIRIAGPVTAGAALDLQAGRGATTFDSAVLPGNTTANWTSTTVTDESGSVVVEILRPGVLQANRIGIEVTGQGSGVRFAGEAMAGARGFTLRADGEVVLGRAAISGANVGIEAKTFRDVDSSLSAEESLVVSATGSFATFMGSQTRAADLSVISAGDLTFGQSVDRIFSAELTGGSAFTAAGRLQFSGAEIRAANSLSFESDGETTLAASRLHAKGHLVGAAGSISLDASSEATELVAEAGSLVLSTLDDLTNTGGLIQGAGFYEGVQTPSGQVAEGAVTLHLGGRFSQKAAASPAIVFATDGDLVIRTGGDIDNLQSRLLANGAILATAGGDIRNLGFDPSIGTGTLSNSTRRQKKPFWAFWRSAKTSMRLSYAGVPVDPERIGTITAGRSVDLHAGGLMLNQGGEINANGGDISISARKVETIGLIGGSMTVALDCKWSCHAQSQGTVSLIGGRISASGNITATATDAFENTGGQVYAMDGVEISSDRITATARPIPLLISRPGGLYNLWAGPTMRLLLRDQYGLYISETADLVLSSTSPIEVAGGQLIAGKTLVTPTGISSQNSPGGSDLSARSGTIGLFSSLPRIDH